MIAATRPGYDKAKRRMTRSREALLEAGLELFAERPVDAVSIDEIVAAAGVAKGTFFNHFADKHAFANAIASAIRLEIEARVTEINRDVADPMERLSNGMRVAGEFALSHRTRAQLLLRTGGTMPGRDHPLNEGVAKDIDAAVKSGQARREAEGQGVLFWLSLCQGLMAQLTRESLSPASAEDAIVAMIRLGIAGIEKRVGGN